MAICDVVRTLYRFVLCAVRWISFDVARHAIWRLNVISICGDDVICWMFGWIQNHHLPLPLAHMHMHTYIFSCEIYFCFNHSRLHDVRVVCVCVCAGARSHTWRTIPTHMRQITKTKSHQFKKNSFINFINIISIIIILYISLYPRINIVFVINYIGYSYSWLPFNDESRSISCIVIKQRTTDWSWLGRHYEVQCAKTISGRSTKPDECGWINQTGQRWWFQIDWIEFE